MVDTACSCYRGMLAHGVNCWRLLLVTTSQYLAHGAQSYADMHVLRLAENIGCLRGQVLCIKA